MAVPRGRYGAMSNDPARDVSARRNDEMRNENDRTQVFEDEFPAFSGGSPRGFGHLNESPNSWMPSAALEPCRNGPSPFRQGGMRGRSAAKTRTRQSLLSGSGVSIRFLGVSLAFSWHVRARTPEAERPVSGGSNRGGPTSFSGAPRLSPSPSRTSRVSSLKKWSSSLLASLSRRTYGCSRVARRTSSKNLFSSVALYGEGISRP